MTGPVPAARDDFDRLAHELVVMILGRGSVDDTVMRKVSDRLRWGPQITIWPRDIAEASQRARDRARAAAAPVLPRGPVIPTLPRPAPLPNLPRPPTIPALPSLPRPSLLPTLPRIKP